MKWRLENIKNIVGEPITGEWGEEGGDVKVLRTTNFTNDGSLDLSEVVERDIDVKKVQKKRLQFGDTIIEKSGGSPSQPVGRVVYFNIDSEEPYLCNNFTSVLRPNSYTDSKYLFWFLFYNHLTKNTLRFQNKTTGIINLQLPRYLSELQIPLPSLTLQQKIAAILDEADAMRRKDKALLAKYDVLLQAVFYDMFGDPVKNEKKWEVKQIKDITENLDSYRKPVKSSDRAETQGIYPYYGATGVIDYVNEYLLDGQFLLISEDGKNLVGRYKKIAFIATGKIWVNNHAHVLNSRKNCNNFYLEHFLNVIDLKQYVTGIDQYKLNRSNLDIIPILVPPIKLQNEFAGIVQNIENQKAQIIQQQTYSESLFQSLIQQAFKGELVL